MANTLTPLQAKILANIALVLRKRCTMPQFVNSDLQPFAAQKSAVINVPVPQKGSVHDATPGAVPPQPADTSSATIPVTLDRFSEASFYLTDKDELEVEKKDFWLPDIAKAQAIALADSVNNAILSEYKRVYGLTGTPGTQPFKKVTTLNDDGDAYVIEARRLHNQQLAPREDRYLVLDGLAEAGALGLEVFKSAEKRGDNGQTKRDGEVGRAYGYNFMHDEAVPTHTAGTISNGSGRLAKVNGAVSVGAVSFAIDETTLTGTLLTGDIFTVAGDTQTYVVTSGPHTAASNAIASISFDPPAKVAWADNAVVTVVATHTVNLAFQKSAFAFANRLLSDVEFKGADIVQPVTDPVSNLNFQLTIKRGHLQTMWYLHFLYGVRLIQPELCVRLAG